MYDYIVQALALGLPYQNTFKESTCHYDGLRSTRSEQIEVLKHHMQNKIQLVSSDSIIDFVSPSADILKEPFILIFATVIQSY